MRRDCPACEGTGEGIADGVSCSLCKGKGMIEVEEEKRKYHITAFMIADKEAELDIMIADKEAELDIMIDEYLSERGWERSCDYPDSVWRWEKEIDGRILVLSRSAAYSLQNQIDSLEEVEEEDK